MGGSQPKEPEKPVSGSLPLTRTGQGVQEGHRQNDQRLPPRNNEPRARRQEDQEGHREDGEEQRAKGSPGLTSHPRRS